MINCVRSQFFRPNLRGCLGIKMGGVGKKKGRVRIRSLRLRTLVDNEVDV